MRVEAIAAAVLDGAPLPVPLSSSRAHIATLVALLRIRPPRHSRHLVSLRPSFLVLAHYCILGIISFGQSAYPLAPSLCGETAVQ